MKKFNFLENLLRREFAMSGMSGMRGMKGLRVDAVNPDSQPTVNRQSRLTSQQRHNSVSGARVAREWLKYAAMFVMLVTIGVGNVWGEGTESFENLSSATSYASRSWTGTNGQSGWAATNARTDQKTAGSRGLTFKASTASTITMKLTSTQQSAGFGVLTFKYKYPYSDSGKSRVLSITIGKNTYSSGTLSYTSSATTGTITVNQSLTSATVTIDVNDGGGRICVDEFSWTSYTPATTVSLTKAASSNGSFTLTQGGSAVTSVTTTSAAQTVTVTGSPSAGYYLSNVTQSGASAAPTITKTSATTYTIQYAKGCSGTSTITATFSPIWYLKGDFNSWGTTDPLTNITSNVATVTKSLSKTTAYGFKVYNAQDDQWYGNNGKIIDDISGWTFSTSEGDCKVFATVADDYTFKFNISNQQMQIIYPDMTHPNDAYVYLTKWWDCYVHYWYTDGGGDHALVDWGYDTQLSRYEEICETDYWCVPILDGYPKLIMKDNAGDPSNTTGDQTTASNAGKYITHNGSAWVWNTFGTYTITFAGNGNTGGSMSNVNGICPNGSTTLAANGYTKTGYTFSGWKTNVAVTANGSPVAANGIVPAGATISSINSNITLTAQWSANVYTITSTLSNCTSDPAIPSSYTYTGSAANVTYTISANSGYRLPTSVTVSGSTYTWDSGTGKLKLTGTITSNVSITVTAVQTHNISWYVGGTEEENKLTTGSQTTVVDHNSKVTTLPTTPSGAACDLTFVGWTNTTSYTHGTSTLFTTASSSPAITGATNFYAVFAEGSAPETKSLTNAEITSFYCGTNDCDIKTTSYDNGPFTITSSDGNWYGVCCAANTSSVYSVNVRENTATIGGNSVRPYLQSPVYSKDIASVTFTHGCTADGRSIYICSSATEDPANDKIVIVTTNNSNTSGVSVNLPSGVTQIYLYAAGGAITIKSIAVTIGGYSDHTLTCEECGTSVTPTFTASPTGGTVAVSHSGVPVASGDEVKTCGGVALSVTITPDHHKITGFTATGLTTGTATITPSVASTLPKSVAQTFTVTVSNGATGTLNLTPTFEENPYRTVVFKSNNEALFDDGGETTTFDADNNWKQKVYVGEKPVLPTALVAGQACDGSSTTFMGWVADNDRWPGKEASGMPAGKTLITAASGFAAAAAGTGEIAYHAVWAEKSGGEVTDVINNSVTSSHLGATGTSSWVTIWETGAMTSGAKYKIYSMGINGAKNYALQWNSSGYLFCSSAPSSGYKLISITATALANKNIGLYASTSVYTAKATATSLNTLSATTSGATYDLNATQLAANYTCPAVNGTASSTQIVSISFTYSNVSYSNYMTTCCASAGLTLEGPTGNLIFITSAAEKKVRSQEAFHISGCGVSGSQTVSFNFGSSALNAKFTCATETGGALTTSCDGIIDTDFYIYYTPGAGDTSDGIDKSTSLTASVGGTLSASSDPFTEKTIIGRHLPANFVIAAKYDGKWYALPANMSNTTPAPVEIKVDNTTKPTMAANPEADVYSLYPPTANNITTGNGQYIRLAMHGVAQEGSLPAPLFGSATGTAKLGKSGTSVITSDLPGGGWWWKLQQTNASVSAPEDATYNIYGANNTNSLKLYNNGEKWGLYADGPKNIAEVRLIPWITDYLAAEVVEWTEDDILVNASPSSKSATKVTATIGASAESSKVTLANASASSHLVTFTDKDLSGATGRTMVLKWYNSSNALVAASFADMPGIIATTATSWASIATTPTIDDVVVLKGPVAVGATGKAKRVVLDQSSTNTGALDISAGKELIVAETVRKFDGTSFGATGEYDININSTSSLGLGALVMGTHDGTNKATVNFYTKSTGKKEQNTSVAQYVGTPFNDENNILYNWYNSWMYRIKYTSNVIGWERVNENEKMNPFEGYCVFSADAWDSGTGHSYWQQGTLVSSENHTCSSLNWQSGVGTANENNENLLANSWMAPIKIKAFESGDFVNTVAAIYIFNSTSKSAYTSLASNYETFTPGTAEATDVIPSMQSFSVFTNATGGSSVTLDYKKLVYDPAIAGVTTNPNFAPRRSVSDDKPDKMRLYINSENGYGDMLYLLERADFSEGFENGWDGPKLFGESVAPQLYAITPDGNMAINCVPDWEGTVVGFRAGTEDNMYTFSFEYEGEQTWYLNDLKTEQSTRILSGNTYAFSTASGDMEARFIISATPISKVPTGIENGEAGKNVHKLLIDGILYIIRNGRMYDATGVMIR